MTDEPAGKWDIGLYRINRIKEWVQGKWGRTSFTWSRAAGKCKHLIGLFWLVLERKRSHVSSRALPRPTCSPVWLFMAFQISSARITAWWGFRISAQHVLHGYRVCVCVVLPRLLGSSTWSLRELPIRRRRKKEVTKTNFYSENLGLLRWRDIEEMAAQRHKIIDQLLMPFRDSEEFFPWLSLNLLPSTLSRMCTLVFSRRNSPPRLF